MEKKFNELLFLTSFCFMACDGTIAKEEIDVLERLSKESLFGDINIKERFNHYVELLKQLGNEFVSSYIDTVAAYGLNEVEQIQLLLAAAKTIYADKSVEYEEIKLFKVLRSKLSIQDSEILNKVSGVEEFWLEKDAISDSSRFISNLNLSEITIE